MNLKTILTTSLLVLILLTTVSFGFLSYGIYNDTVAQTGATMMGKHQVMFYVMTVLYVLTFGAAGAVFYKA